MAGVDIQDGGSDADTDASSADGNSGSGKRGSGTTVAVVIVVLVLLLAAAVAYIYCKQGDNGNVIGNNTAFALDTDHTVIENPTYAETSAEVGTASMDTTYADLPEPLEANCTGDGTEYMDIAATATAAAAATEQNNVYDTGVAGHAVSNDETYDAMGMSSEDDEDLEC